MLCICLLPLALSSPEADAEPGYGHGRYGHHQQAHYAPKCRTVYETVTSSACSDVTDTACTTRVVTSSRTETREECTTTTEQQCSTTSKEGISKKDFQTFQQTIFFPLKIFFFVEPFPQSVDEEQCATSTETECKDIKVQVPESVCETVEEEVCHDEAECTTEQQCQDITVREGSY